MKTFATRAWQLLSLRWLRHRNRKRPCVESSRLRS
ncbi:MAG: hypothetical protein ACK5C0_01125 [Candidatus Kapaibacterium sp.]